MYISDHRSAIDQGHVLFNFRHIANAIRAPQFPKSNRLCVAYSFLQDFQAQIVSSLPRIRMSFLRYHWNFEGLTQLAVSTLVSCYRVLNSLPYLLGPDAQKTYRMSLTSLPEAKDAAPRILDLEFYASELRLRGQFPVVQPHIQGGNILCWNGEVRVYCSEVSLKLIYPDDIRSSRE